MAKVKIVSKHNGPVSVKIPDQHFSREWANKGASVMVEQDQLEEMMYDPGFNYMIQSGILYIEDLDVKKALGLEPEDAEAPVNIIVPEDSVMRRQLTVTRLDEFKAFVKSLSYEQLLCLADFAILNELGDFQRAQVIKQACGKDVIKAIELNRLDKEG